MTRLCEYCGGDITHKKSNARFCSATCKALWHKKKRKTQVALVKAAPPPPPMLYTGEPEPVPLSEMPLQPFLEWTSRFPTLVQGILLKWYEDGTLARLESRQATPEDVIKVDPALDDLDSAVLRTIAEAVAKTPEKD